MICPVRGHDETEYAAIVSKLEMAGWKVHWPARDTPQDDPIGDTICRYNRAAIQDADHVFVIWDGRSQGCLFDLGMAFALFKPITVVEIPPPTEGKSFQNMIRAWADDSEWLY